MDHKLVVDELTQGKEFAKQLQIHLNNPSSSHETQEMLIHSILNSYDRSLSLLTTRGLTANGNNGELHLHGGMGIKRMDSQVSFSEGPHNEDSDPEFKDFDYIDVGAKRKSNIGGIEKWKNQVKVREDMGFEEALDDGYSWRKYGQKDILGAKHPRGYYRCTNRQLQGCLATKHVQRTDDNPNVFNVSYLGSHTCNPRTDTSSPFPVPLPSSPPQKIQHPLPKNQFLRSFETLPTIQTSHKASTDNLETLLFNFPSTSNDNFVFPKLDNTFDGNKTPSLIYPPLSRSSHFTMSQAQMSMGEKPNSAVVVESELNDVVSAATSFTSLHNVDMAFQFGELEFGKNFNVDNLIFFD
ncbi:hypothetical protein L1887_16927 [Cichorium endivia]|nr:hypothetical protein L1887_16927 [Cichorium endivia]